jgi:hypothetical protein
VSGAIKLRHDRQRLRPVRFLARQGLCAEVAKHGVLAKPQLLGNGLPRPPLMVAGPDLLMERQPLRLADQPGDVLGHRVAVIHHANADLLVRLALGELATSPAPG